MSGLFQSRSQSQTLAVRMRPRDISEFLGQRHLLGEGKILNRALKAGRISSLIFYGPPGTGKTCLALVIREKLNAYFVRLNAVASNVQEIRDVLRSAKYKLEQEIANIHRREVALKDGGSIVVDTGTASTITAVGQVDLVAVTPGPPLVTLRTLVVDVPASQVIFDQASNRAALDKRRQHLHRQAEVGGNAGDVRFGAGYLDHQRPAGMHRLAVGRRQTDAHAGRHQQGIPAVSSQCDSRVTARVLPGIGNARPVGVGHGLFSSTILPGMLRAWFAANSSDGQHLCNSAAHRGCRNALCGRGIKQEIVVPRLAEPGGSIVRFCASVVLTTMCTYFAGSVAPSP